MEVKNVKKAGKNLFLFETDNSFMSRFFMEKIENTGVFRSRAFKSKYEDQSRIALSDGKYIRMCDEIEEDVYLEHIEKRMAVIGDGFLEIAESMLIKSTFYGNTLCVDAEGYSSNLRRGVVTGKNVAVATRNGKMIAVSLETVKSEREIVTSYPLFLFADENDGPELIFLPYVQYEKKKFETNMLDNLYSNVRKTRLVVFDREGKKFLPEETAARQAVFLSPKDILVRCEDERFLLLSKEGGKWIALDTEKFSKKGMTGALKSKLSKYFIEKAYPVAEKTLLLQYERLGGDAKSKSDYVLCDLANDKIVRIGPKDKERTFLFSDPLSGKISLGKTEEERLYVYRNGKFEEMGEAKRYFSYSYEYQDHMEELSPLSEKSVEPMYYGEMATFVLVRDDGDPVGILSNNPANVFVVSEREDFPYPRIMIGENGILIPRVKDCFIPIPSGGVEKFEMDDEIKIYVWNGNFEKTDETAYAGEARIHLRTDEKKGDGQKIVRLMSINMGKRNFVLFLGECKEGDESPSVEDMGIVEADGELLLYLHEKISSKEWRSRLLPLKDRGYTDAEKEFTDEITVGGKEVALYPFPKSGIWKREREKITYMFLDLERRRWTADTLDSSEIREIHEKAKAMYGDTKFFPSDIPLRLTEKDEKNPFYAIGYESGENGLFFPILYSRKYGFLKIDDPAPENVLSDSIREEISPEKLEYDPLHVRQSLYSVLINPTDWPRRDYTLYVKSVVDEKKREKEISKERNENVVSP